MVRDETNDRDDTNDTNEQTEGKNAATDALTDDQLDEVAGAGSEALGPGRDARLPKPYPPWPRSN